MSVLRVNTLGSIHDTGREMARMVTAYYTDLARYQSSSLKDYFDIVKNLRYRRDPNGIEFVTRPKIAFNPLLRFRDCDDKSVLIGSFLYLKKIPFRFLAVSNQIPTRPGQEPKIHHVLVQAIINGRRRIIDATYPKNKLFHFKPITKAVAITPFIQRM